ncbi:MAG: hypothetical protein ACJAYF_003496 [Arenicella sp.]
MRHQRGCCGIEQLADIAKPWSVTISWQFATAVAGVHSFGAKDTLKGHLDRTKKTHRCRNFVAPLGGSWFGLALRAAPLVGVGAP